MSSRQPDLHIVGENKTTQFDDNIPDDWVIRTVNLSKQFEIYLNDRQRLFEFFGNRAHHQDHWALRDLNFSVRRGQCFGIIGSNGAGKSTLLKIIGGITAPTKGYVHLRSEISTLLDLGLGFHASFSGRENIRMNCKLLGMSENAIQEAIPKIISFAGLGDFIDYPVRTYSAGMHLRLGFAIAAHAPADVLLIDEVLTVGDQRFQRKCVKKIEEFIEKQKTIILVSHDLHAIRSLCHDVMWLEDGRIYKIGPAKDIVDQYLDVERSRNPKQVISGPFLGSTQRPPKEFSLSFKSTLEDPKLKEALLEACYIPTPKEHFAPVQTEPFDIVEGERAVVQGTGEIRILRVQILDREGQPRERFQSGEDLIVAVTFRTTELVPRPIFGVALFRTDGIYIHGPNTRFDNVLDDDYNGVYTFFIRWKEIPLLSGSYRLSIAVFDQNHLKPHIWHNQLYEIEIHAPIEDHGLMVLDHDWGVITHWKEE
jgi:lipopolysaccharide transport system ATP-binding protein